ncbi:drug resistance transporter, EmrB/QacA protein [Arthrobacter sp. Hiyo1]|nr:drug resistance transporter, EmrB/QacA protein [Arthrobacter sp. Hiyo1]
MDCHQLHADVLRAAVVLGTFSDRVWARGAYGLGMVLFTSASAACAFSPALPALIAGRILQGIGAAMITQPLWRSSGRLTAT